MIILGQGLLKAAGGYKGGRLHLIIRGGDYLSRHGKEDHSAKNIKSAAFMSAHLLWGKPTLQASISDVNKRFNINVKLI